MSALMSKYILNVASGDEIIATHTFNSTAAAMVMLYRKSPNGILFLCLRFLKITLFMYLTSAMRPMPDISAN